jgi:signal transduction histidine kinase
MSQEASFFNVSIKNILSDDQSIMDRARIRLIYYGLLLSFVGVLALLPNVYSLHANMQLSVGLFLLAAFVILFKYFTYRPNWKLISHISLIIGTCIIFSCVYVLFQDVNIIVIQLVILIILFGYYMLGVTAGTIYSLANLFLIFAFMVYTNENSLLSYVKPEKIDGYTIIVSAFFNFILIMFIQGHFYGAFLRNINEVNELAQTEKELNQELAIAIDKAEKSSQVQSEFLSTMSHEIRTPLNAVIEPAARSKRKFRDPAICSGQLVVAH